MGINRLHEQNEACSRKLGWQAASSHSLWAAWMTSNYFPKSTIWSSSTPKSRSCIWWKIGQVAHFIHSGCRWIIRNGNKVDIWHDYWAEDTSLASLFPSFSFPRFNWINSLKHYDTWVLPEDIILSELSPLGWLCRTYSSIQPLQTPSIGKPTQVKTFLSKKPGSSSFLERRRWFGLPLSGTP